jgi:transposase-like protein
MNDKIKGLSASERGKEIGNSPTVNKAHYTGQLDDELLQMAAEIRSLKQQIVELQEENQALKRAS